MFVRERSEWFNRDYLTYGAIRSSGDLIWGIADDIEMLTYNWDKLLISKVLEFENVVRSKTLDNYYLFYLLHHRSRFLQKNLILLFLLGIG